MNLNSERECKKEVCQDQASAYSKGKHIDDLLNARNNLVNELKAESNKLEIMIANKVQVEAEIEYLKSKINLYSKQSQRIDSEIKKLTE